MLCTLLSVSVLRVIIVSSDRVNVTAVRDCLHHPIGVVRFKRGALSVVNRQAAEHSFVLFPIFPALCSPTFHFYLSLWSLSFWHAKQVHVSIHVSPKVHIFLHTFHPHTHYASNYILLIIINNYIYK